MALCARVCPASNAEDIPEGKAGIGRSMPAISRSDSSCSAGTSVLIHRGSSGHGFYGCCYRRAAPRSRPRPRLGEAGRGPSFEPIEAAELLTSCVPGDDGPEPFYRRNRLHSHRRTGRERRDHPRAETRHVTQRMPPRARRSALGANAARVDLRSVRTAVTGFALRWRMQSCHSDGLFVSRR